MPDQSESHHTPRAHESAPLNPREDIRLQLALEAASDGIWDWDIPSGKTCFSPRYFTMLGYEPDELEQSFATWEALLHPEDKERTKAKVFAHIERGQPFDVEFRLRTKAGGWHWVLGRGKIMERDQEGRPRRMVGIHVDIHERKLMQQRLQEHMEELRALNTLSIAVAQSITLEDVVDSALDSVLTTLSPDLTLLYMLEDTGMRLKGVRSNLPNIGPIHKETLASGECLCGLAARDATPQFSLNIHNDVRCTNDPCKICGIRSYASLPLLASGEVIGILGLGSLRELDFAARASFLQSLSALVSTGLTNALLHQRVLAHAEELERTVGARTATLDKYRSAVEHSSACIVITDSSGAIEYVNPAFTSLTGYTLDEARGQNPRVLKSGIHDEDFYRAMWQTLLAGKTWRGELCNRAKDGVLYWEEATITPMLDAHGAITNYVAVKEDITERKRSEDLLRESERRYKTVFNASRDAILIADSSTRSFIHANKAAEKLLGYAPGELIGKSVSDIHPPEELPYIQEQFEIQSRGETHSIIELPCLRKDGSVIYTDLSASLVVIDDRLCLMGFFRDVTERKEAEKLRQDVEHITRHDLKSPLNGVIAIPQLLLEDDNLTGEQREYLQHIMDAGHKMLSIINLSLTLYQIESGAYVPSRGAFDLMKVLRQCMADTRHPAKGKLVSLSLETRGWSATPPEKVFVNGEELLAFSVFSNLLLNAVEASPSRETVTVVVQYISGVTNVIIHNQGAVPTNIRTTFFDKYATSGKPLGTGLGTYSARLLAEVQGWSIGMSTDEMEGTFLTVGIPA
jgi:PAS domain S-box-containing protein